MDNIVYFKSGIRANASEELGKMANDPATGEELSLALARLKEAMDKKRNWRGLDA